MQCIHHAAPSVLYTEPSIPLLCKIILIALLSIQSVSGWSSSLCHTQQRHVAAKPWDGKTAYKRITFGYLHPRRHFYYQTKNFGANSDDVDTSNINIDTSSNEVGTTTNDLFFVRDAHMADLGAVASILTYNFFANNTNFITFQWERLNTFLSLESTFPTIFDHGLHRMFVACRNDNARVIGFAELDCRENNLLMSSLPQPQPMSPESIIRTATRTNTETQQEERAEGRNVPNPPRPYMCNLAVDKNWKRKGIASALIKECENTVTKIGKDCIYLKVRQTNQPAISLYKANGYSIIKELLDEQEQGSNDKLFLLCKDLDCSDATSNEYQNQPTKSFLTPRNFTSSSSY